ncbi:MAG: C-GCAxxG-C-C family protein [Bacillota bacterium]
MSEVTNCTAPAVSADKKPIDPDAWKKELEGKSEKVVKAVTNHHKKYNCAQAVACAFAEDLGMDEKTVFRMMEGFGFGMGSMHECGAVSAMAAIAGLKESDGNMDAPASKKASYKASKAMLKAFEEKNGSTICRVIKGVDTKKVLRSCDGCVEDAAEIVEKYLKGEL